MKHTIAIVALLLAFAFQASAQEYRGAQLELLVSNSAGRDQLLTIGVREGASTGIDTQLGEAELPPQPPNEIFDARCASTPGASQLGAGSLNDFRPFAASGTTFSMRYTIAYQAGLNATSVKLSWPETYSGRITKLMVDDVDMQGKTDVESQFATGQFSVEVFFDMSPLGFTATPNPIVFTVYNRGTLPSVNLLLTPTGDTDAEWTLDKVDLDWVDLEPSWGSGQQTVVVSVNTHLLAEGTYNGVIRVRSLAYPAELDIPVTMTMIVGVANVPLPGALWMGQNYPNPFNPTTMIEVDLGTVQTDAVPRLVVHDLLGRVVADLSSSVRSMAGRQSVVFNAEGIPGGVYTYTLSQGASSLTRSMTVLK